MSLKTDVVHTDFKMARVVPLFKKSDKNMEGIYRPFFSNLPVILTVFEQIVYNQFNSYLCDNNLIYKYQAGFRASIFTEIALTYSCEFNIAADLYTGLFLLDLQKAFDIVDHSFLIKQIEAVGTNTIVVN